MPQCKRFYEVTASGLGTMTEGLRPVSGIFDNPIGPVVAVAAWFDRGEFNTHWHDWGQMAFSVERVLSVRTDAGYWVVPPARAVWIPPLQKHSLHIRRPLELRSLYIEPVFAESLPDHCCVLQPSRLLIDIVERLLEYPVNYSSDSPQARLAGVAVDELKVAPRTPLQVPKPTAPKLVAIAEHTINHPADNQTLAQWGSKLGASERTLARLFRQNTGMTFPQWRQQIRLSLALQMLAEAQPVKQIAYELGYENPSAFISMFRKSLGTTPSQYFS